LIAEQARSHVLRAVGWSAAFLVVSRLSSVLAVPVVLHSLGPALYAVWVVGGVLVGVQSLFDLGVSTAMARFVAVAAARQSRPAVLTIFWRSLLFYVVLSLVVSVPLYVFAGDVSGLFPSLDGHAEAQAALLLRYAAVAFALTNITLVLASVLQGVDRVDAAYRGQTIGWVLYVPLLLAGVQLGDSVHAVGLAWVLTYGLQVLLLARDTWTAVGGLPKREEPTPSIRQMLSLGAWWQLSSWADFATFQLPRLIGGLALSPSALISVDVAIRGAQVVVAPFFAVYPLVLPTVTKLWTVRGEDAVRGFLERWFVFGAIALAAFAVPFIPLEGPALAAWTGRSTASFSLWLDGAVLLGVCAHASTGLFTAARLSLGQVAPIVTYKKHQLLTAIVLLPPAALAGAVAIGFALGIALFAPALAFNRNEAKAFGLTLPSLQSPLWRRLVIGLTFAVAVLSFLTALLEGAWPPWIVASTTLALWLGVCGAVTIWCWRYWAVGRAARSNLDETKVQRAIS
jgi:O-antigen/teichoic acid export membrane protein